jgi:molybdopterin-guanine dinucleotide biosynthesis protein B
MKIMRGIAVVGYKKSGKTSLISGILKELKKRGIKHITVLKHGDSEMGVDEKNDTAKFYPWVDQVIGSFKDGSIQLNKGSLSYSKIINNLTCEVLIIEGYKKMANLPRIICLNELNELKDFSNGLEIGTFSLKVSGDNLWSEEDFESIVDRILKVSFVLPNYDCGKCGRDDCRGLALDLLRNKDSLKQCEYLEEDKVLTLKIDGDIVKMKPFVADTLKNTISGFLKSLKDIDGEFIEIKFKSTG